MDKIIPTDKKGQTYYGPKTLKEALEVAADMNAKETLAVATSLTQHGYDDVAESLLAHFGGRVFLEENAN